MVSQQFPIAIRALCVGVCHLNCWQINRCCHIPNTTNKIHIFHVHEEPIIKPPYGL